MATLVVYPTNSRSGLIESVASTYSTALAGNSLTTTFDLFFVGQIYDPNVQPGLEYQISQAFMEYDTSSIPDNAPITSVQLSSSLINDNSYIDFTILVSQFDFGTLGESDWRTPSQLNSLSVAFSRSTSGLSDGSQFIFNKNSGAESTINKTGYTRYVCYSSRNRDQLAPTQIENVRLDPPALTVTYTDGGIKRWDGSTWVKHPVKVWNGSSWVSRPVKVWDGSQWVRRA